MSNCIRVEGLHAAIDIVGTDTVNTSIGSTILAGAKVAKQGSRASSSACGSADVLEVLGVNIELGPEGIRQFVNEVGVGFMMSANYHPAMKIVRPVRKKLKIKTVFNILGPLLNPTTGEPGFGCSSPRRRLHLSLALGRRLLTTF